MSYAASEFYYHFCDVKPKIPKMPKQPKRKQKNQDTSITLNNVILSFQKGSLTHYDRNNLYNP